MPVTFEDNRRQSAAEIGKSSQGRQLASFDVELDEIDGVPSERRKHVVQSYARHTNHTFRLVIRRYYPPPWPVRKESHRTVTITGGRVHDMHAIEAVEPDRFLQDRHVRWRRLDTRDLVSAGGGSEGEASNVAADIEDSSSARCHFPQQREKVAAARRVHAISQFSRVRVSALTVYDTDEPHAVFDHDVVLHKRFRVIHHAPSPRHQQNPWYLDGSARSSGQPLTSRISCDCVTTRSKSAIDAQR